MINKINLIYEEKVKQIEEGKKIFFRLFQIDNLHIDDSFILILTDNLSVISYGIKYLNKFKEYHRKRKVYVVHDQDDVIKLPNDSNIVNIRCEKNDIHKLSMYLRLFQIETSVIFLTEKDDYGGKAEILLQRGEFTLEEYIAIGKYHLDRLEKEK